MENRRVTNTKNDITGTQNIPIDMIDNTIILTSVVRQFLNLNLLLEQKKILPTIGIVTGPAGIGKTVALSCLHHTLAQEAHSPQSSLVLNASPFLTPSRLVSQLFQQLDTSPDHSGHSLSIGLRQQGIRLLLIDNADLLKAETWEMLYMLSDETPCSLLLVGHPELYRHIERHPYVMDRISFTLDLQPASFDEVLHIILPHLAGDKWAFHAENDEDQRLAKELWFHVAPSLRRLRNVLDTAGVLARSCHESGITPAHLSQALKLLPPSMQNHVDEEKTIPVSTLPIKGVVERLFMVQNRR
jgi:AAA domain